MADTVKPRKSRKHQPPLSPKRLAKLAAQEERDDQAYRLFMSGQDLTKAAIARALGMVDSSHVLHAIKRVLARKRMTELEIRDLRQRSQDRLDALAASVAAEAFNGLPEVNKDGSPTGYTALERLQARVLAGDALQRRDESLRRLLGVDAAMKLEQSGPNGGPIVSVTLDDALKAREETIEAARAAALKNLE